jgi:hypothetical protein
MKKRTNYSRPSIKMMGKISKLTLSGGSAGGDANMVKNGMGM